MELTKRLFISYNCVMTPLESVFSNTGRTPSEMGTDMGSSGELFRLAIMGALIQEIQKGPITDLSGRVAEVYGQELADRIEWPENNFTYRGAKAVKVTQVDPNYKQTELALPAVTMEGSRDQFYLVSPGGSLHRVKVDDQYEQPDFFVENVSLPFADNSRVLLEPRLESEEMIHISGTKHTFGNGSTQTLEMIALESHDVATMAEMGILMARTVASWKKLATGKVITV